MQLDETSGYSNGDFEGVSTRSRVTQRFEIYNPRSREQLERLKAMGFTQVILDWPDLHPDATEVGLDVVMANWWSVKTNDEQVERAIALAKQVDRQRLVAVSMMDEPERYATDTPFEFYRSLYQHLRAQFDEELPGVKLEISHWGPLPSWDEVFYRAFVPLYQATDRIRLMPYPDLSEGPLAEVYYQMMRSRKLMEMADRDLPQVVILQTWVIPDEPKLPTIDELRVMAMTAMLAGADTLSFFNYDPKVWEQTPGFSEGFAELLSELTDFSRRYAAADVECQLSSAGILRATLTQSDTSPASVIVNTKRSTVDGLPPLAVVIEDLNDTRLVPQAEYNPCPRGRIRWRRRARIRCR